MTADVQRELAAALTANDYRPATHPDLLPALLPTVQRLIADAEKRAAAAAVAQVEALAERWEKLGEEYLLRSQAPGTNLGQRYSGWELSSDYHSRAEVLRAALESTP